MVGAHGSPRRPSLRHVRATQGVHGFGTLRCIAPTPREVVARYRRIGGAR
jgi:hypothetical protein